MSTTDGAALSPHTHVPAAKTFLWGVSTSSFRIEGGSHVDGRGDSIWDSYCHQQGRIKNGDTADIACDHYHRYREDIALMRDIGVGAYRFSILWPRILPRGRGAANEVGLAYHDRIVDAFLAAGIEPWICLYHWDLPQALQDLGGWRKRDIAGWFADYTALVPQVTPERARLDYLTERPGAMAASMASS